MKMEHVEPIGKITTIPLCGRCGARAAFAIDVATSPNPAELPSRRHACDDANHFLGVIATAGRYPGATSIRVIGKAGLQFTLSVREGTL